MASENHSQTTGNPSLVDNSLVNDPNFATICSFIEKFGEICHIGILPFSQLQEMLENTNDVPLPLVQLHIRLLRRVFKSINTSKWEKSVSKFAHMYNSQDGWEVERFGYKKSKVQTKLRILKNLLESQFDYNPKFKGEVNKLPASDLRLAPLGRDAQGHCYWCHVDQVEANLRVYREDVEGETWEIVASSREEMEQLITQLQSGEIRKAKSVADDEAIEEEDDTNGLTEVEILKDILLDTGKLLPDDDDIDMGSGGGCSELSDDSNSLEISLNNEEGIDNHLEQSSGGSQPDSNLPTTTAIPIVDSDTVSNTKKKKDKNDSDSVDLVVPTEAKSHINENENFRDCIANTPLVPDSSFNSMNVIESSTKYKDKNVIPSLESAIRLPTDVKTEQSGGDGVDNIGMGDTAITLDDNDKLNTNKLVQEQKNILTTTYSKVSPQLITESSEIKIEHKSWNDEVDTKNISSSVTTNVLQSDHVNSFNNKSRIESSFTNKEVKKTVAEKERSHHQQHDFIKDETISPYFVNKSEDEKKAHSDMLSVTSSKIVKAPEICETIQIDSSKQKDAESHQQLTATTILVDEIKTENFPSEHPPSDMTVHSSSSDAMDKISLQQDNIPTTIHSTHRSTTNPTHLSTPEETGIKSEEDIQENISVSPYFEKIEPVAVVVDTLPEISSFTPDDIQQQPSALRPLDISTVHSLDVSSSSSPGLVIHEEEEVKQLRTFDCFDEKIVVPSTTPIIAPKFNAFNIDSMLRRHSTEKQCQSTTEEEMIEQLPIQCSTSAATNSSSLFVSMDSCQTESCLQTTTEGSTDATAQAVVVSDILEDSKLTQHQEEGLLVENVSSHISAANESQSENSVNTETVTQIENIPSELKHTLELEKVLGDDNVGESKSVTNDKIITQEIQLNDSTHNTGKYDQVTTNLSTCSETSISITAESSVTAQTTTDNKSFSNDSSESLVQISQSISTTTPENKVVVSKEDSVSTTQPDQTDAEVDSTINNSIDPTTIAVDLHTTNNISCSVEGVKLSSEPQEEGLKKIKTNPLGLVGYDCSSSEDEEESKNTVSVSSLTKNGDSQQQIPSVEKSVGEHKQDGPVVSPPEPSSYGSGQKRKLDSLEPDSTIDDDEQQTKTRKIDSIPCSGNPIVGEEIEEPVFFVTGSGEGALNEGGNDSPSPAETLLPPPPSSDSIQQTEDQRLNSSTLEMDNNTPVKHKGRGRPRKNPPKEVLKDKNVSSAAKVSPDVKKDAKNEDTKKNRRNSFADEVNGVTNSGSVRRSGRVAQIRQKEEEDRRRLEEERLAQLKEAQLRKKQKQLERELKAAKGEGPPVKPPKTPKAPKTPKTPKSAKSPGKPRSGAKPQVEYVQPSSEDDSDTEEEGEEEEYSAKPGKKRRKKRAKNGKGLKKGATPWLHSDSSDEDEAVEEEEEHYDEEEEEEDTWKLKDESDHEFSPESDIEDTEFSPSRHARTAKQKEQAVDKYAETYCEKCAKGDHPEWILLCDSCDHGWHASCVYPQLWVIPEGEWHCPPCQHRMLVEKLSENLIEFDKILKKKDNEMLRKQRLAYVGISLNNVLPSAEKPAEKSEDENGEDEYRRKKSRRRRIYSDDELEDFINDGDDDDDKSSSGSYESDDEPMYQLRARRATKSFSFREYDDMINTALGDDSVDGQEEEPAEKPSGKHLGSETASENDEEEPVKAVKVPESGGGGKKMPDEDTDEEDLDEKEKNRRKMLNQGQRKSRRRLNDLDATSEEDSDEDFKGSGGDDDEEDEEDVVEEDSEWSGDESDDSIAIAKLSRKKRKHRRGPLGRQEKYLDGETVRRSTRRRKSRVVYDESDQEEDEDDQTEKWQSGESEGSDEEEESESESDDETWGKKKKQKKIGASKTKLPNFFLGGSGPNSFKKPKKKKRRRVDEDDVDRAWTNKFGNKAKRLTDEPVERKTRGKQINFKDILDSGESDDDGNIRPKRRRILSDSDDDDVEMPGSSRKLVEEIKAANARAAAEEKLKYEEKLRELAETNKKSENENIQVKAVPSLEDLPLSIPEPEKEEERPVKITNSIVESILMRKTPDIESPARTPPLPPPVPPPSIMEEPPQQTVGPLVGVPSYLASVLSSSSGSARVGKKKTSSMMPANQSGDVLPFPSHSSSKKSSGSGSIPVPPKSLAGALASSSSSASPSTSSIPRSILPPNLPSDLSRIAPMYANNPALMRPFTPWGRNPPPYSGPPPLGSLGKPPPLNSSFMPQPGQLRQPPSSYSPTSSALRIPNPNTLQAFQQQFSKRSSADVGHYRMPPAHQLPSSVLPSMGRERLFLGGSSPYAPYGMLPQSQQHPGLFAPPPFDYRAAESFKEELLERHSQQLHPPIGPPTTLSSLTHSLGQHMKDEMNHPPNQGDGEFGGLVSYFSSQHSNDED